VTKKAGGPSASPVLCFALEPELSAEFGSERFRDNRATGRNIPGGFPKFSILNATEKVVTEIRAIRQVEELADQPEARALSELNFLADPQVQLEKGLATERVEGELFTSARCQTSP